MMQRRLAVGSRSFEACTGILWDDDSQIADLHILKETDKAIPRVETRVWEL